MNITEAIGAKGAAMAPAILRDFRRLAAEAGERHSDSETQDDYTLLRGRHAADETCSREILGWTYGAYAADRRWQDWVFLVSGDLLLAGHVATESYRLFVRTDDAMIWPSSRSSVGAACWGGGPLVEVTGEAGPWRAVLLDALASLAGSLERIDEALAGQKEAAQAAERQREQDAQNSRAGDLERAAAALRR